MYREGLSIAPRASCTSLARLAALAYSHRGRSLFRARPLSSAAPFSMPHGRGLSSPSTRLALAHVECADAAPAPEMVLAAGANASLRLHESDRRGAAERSSRWQTALRLRDSADLRLARLALRSLDRHAEATGRRLLDACQRGSDACAGKWPARELCGHASYVARRRVWRCCPSG